MVLDDLISERESVPDCRRSIRKWPLTKRVCAYSGNTENGSIRRWAKLAVWLIDSQEFSQVVRSSRVEAIITERRVCTVSVNQWVTSQEKRNEEKCGPFQKLSEQGEQRCSEPSVLCLGGTVDSQKKVAKIKKWKNKGRDKSLCGICGQKMMDGTNAKEFKVSLAYQIEDMGFHCQMAIKCNTKVLDRGLTKQGHNL